MTGEQDRIATVHRTYRRALIAVGSTAALGWASYSFGAPLTQPSDFQTGQTIVAQALNDRFADLYDGHNAQETRIDALEAASGVGAVETFHATGTGATGSTNSAVYHTPSIDQNTLGTVLVLLANSTTDGTIFEAQASCLVHLTVSLTESGSNTTGAAVAVNPSASVKTRNAGAIYTDSSVLAFAYHNDPGTDFPSISASLVLDAGDELVVTKAYGENVAGSVNLNLVVEQL